MSRLHPVSAVEPAWNKAGQQTCNPAISQASQGKGMGRAGLARLRAHRDRSTLVVDNARSLSDRLGSKTPGSDGLVEQAWNSRRPCLDGALVQAAYLSALARGRARRGLA